MRVGVLALQGDFERHQAVIRKLGVEVFPVRKPMDLASCQGLIIPGGESTTLVKLLKESGLFDKIPNYASRFPIFGTCAGLILIASKVINNPVESIPLLDVTVQRNAYGRQIESFTDKIQLNLRGKSYSIEGVFIRAPKIIEIGEGVRRLGSHKNDIVLVQKDNILAATFHPELTDSTIIHGYFLEKIKNSLERLLKKLSL